METSALERQLRGDLDWITMRALEKDRTRRYGSPAVLGAEHLEVADALNALGALRFNAADYENAEAFTRESLAIRRRLFTDENLDIAQSLGNLATTLDMKGARDEVEPLYRESLAISRKLRGNDHPEVAGSLEGLAYFFMYEG